MNLKNQTADLEAKSTLRKLIWLMEVLSDGERAEMIDILLDRYCRHCGSNDGYACQCQNDE